MPERAVVQTPVLIIGGGPVGLSLALELACHGIESVVVDQGRGTGAELVGKAGTLNERSMEFVRRWGIEEPATHWGGPAKAPNETVYCTAVFGGHVLGRARSSRPQGEYSPCRWTKCPQTVYDPLVAKTVLATGKVSILYSTRYESLEQDDGEVRADCVDLASGARTRIVARYLVGCDGATSTVREQVGIGYPGKMLDYSLSIMLDFENLAAFTGQPEVERYMLVGPRGVWSNLTFMDYRRMWRMVLVGSQERLSLDRLDVHGELKRALGRDDIPYEVLRAVPWRRSECVAERYRARRVFLAGDAAHSTSPTGGHGLNTGLGDVAGLGWMLAAVLQGWADPRLLDAYEIERLPVAARNGSASTANYRAWVGQVDFSGVLAEDAAGVAARANVAAALHTGLHLEWNSVGIALGYRYEKSPIIVPDGSAAPPDRVEEYVPTTRPGHRAPHAWLAPGRSTLDWYGRGFVLVQSVPPVPPNLVASGDAGTERFIAAARHRGMPIRVEQIVDPAIGALYEQPHVLVRPDGHVAWRGGTLPDDPGEVLDIITGRVRA